MTNNEQFNPEMFETYLPLLKQLLSVQRHLSSAPTFTPQNALEQIQFVDDGDLKVYFYVNGTWGYITLTT